MLRFLAEKLKRKDSEHYVKYAPSDVYSEKGLSLGGSFDLQANSAVLDLDGDDEQTLVKSCTTTKWYVCCCEEHFSSIHITSSSYFEGTENARSLWERVGKSLRGRNVSRPNQDTGSKHPTSQMPTKNGRRGTK